MLAERLTDSFAERGIISDEEKEVICFGLESLQGNLLGIILTLVIGICFRQVEESLILWLLLFPLRKNAGGYHATTKRRCLLVSTIMLIISFVFFSVIECTLLLYSICIVITGIIIWELAPIDNLSKKLDATERKVYRRRTRVILGGEGIIFVLAICFGLGSLAKSVAMTYLIVSISLIMGWVKAVRHCKINECK